ncbi:hypothetical protein ACFELO_05115 [Oceanicaulis sp. LC35]
MMRQLARNEGQAKRMRARGSVRLRGESLKPLTADLEDPSSRRGPEAGREGISIDKPASALKSETISDHLVRESLTFDRRIGIQKDNLPQLPPPGGSRPKRSHIDDGLNTLSCLRLGQIREAAIRADTQFIRVVSVGRKQEKPVFGNTLTWLGFHGLRDLSLHSGQTANSSVYAQSDVEMVPGRVQQAHAIGKACRVRADRARAFSFKLESRLERAERMARISGRPGLREMLDLVVR